jgi:hypothetical protein
LRFLFVFFEYYFSLSACRLLLICVSFAMPETRGAVVRGNGARNQAARSKVDKLVKEVNTLRAELRNVGLVAATTHAALSGEQQAAAKSITQDPAKLLDAMQSSVALARDAMATVRAAGAALEEQGKRRHAGVLTTLTRYAALHPASGAGGDSGGASGAAGAEAAATASGAGGASGGASGAGVRKPLNGNASPFIMPKTWSQGK